jgi:hypothetical protein
MQTMFRRAFLMVAAVTVAVALIVYPAHATKKKAGESSTKVSQSTSSKTKSAPARDAKGHFVKKAEAPAAAAPAPPAVTRARDAKGHFVKQGGSPAPTTPAAAAPTPARDAKGRFLKQGASPAATAPAPPATTPARDAKGRFVKQGGSPTATTPAPYSSSPTVKPNAPAVGNGQVWVNLDSKVYHRQGDRWFGKTKNGKYMSEDEAVRAGYRAVKTGGK